MKRQLISLLSGKHTGSSFSAAWRGLVLAGLAAVTGTAHAQDNLIRPDADPVPGAQRDCDVEPLDRSRLLAAMDWIDNSETALHSFLVYQCGQKIAEDYYLGYDSIMPHDLQSATKTISSMLIGAAMQDGLIDNLDQPLTELLPDYADLMIGAKADITLRHVLSMTSGLRWKDFGHSNSFDEIALADDSVAYILGEPLVSLPGETFFYNTGSSHLLSAIITQVTGKSAFEYADEVLFKPLGMMDYRWDDFADGRNLGGWGLYMRPRDMAKLGQVIIDGGVWKGEQIVDAAFLKEATTAQASTDGAPPGGGYGFQMWIQDDITESSSAAAIGWGGQTIWILGDLDTVVVFTAAVDVQPMQNFEDVRNVVKRYVVGSGSSSNE